MLAEKMKNGFQSQATRTSAIIATALTLITSAFYVGQRVTRIEEAIYRIEVVDFPAFILVDDKGNDFFAQLG